MNTYKKTIGYFIASLCLCLGLVLPNITAQTAFSETYAMVEGLSANYSNNSIKSNLGSNDRNVFVPGCDHVDGFKVLELHKNSVKVGWIHPNTEHEIKYKLSWTNGGQVFTHEIIANANDPKNIDYVLPSLMTNVNYSISIVASCNISVSPTMPNTWTDGEVSTIMAMPINTACEPTDITQSNIDAVQINYTSIDLSTLISNFASTSFVEIRKIADGKVIFKGVNPGVITDLEACEDYQLEWWYECTIDGKTVVSGTGTKPFKTLCCGNIKSLTALDTWSDDFQIGWGLAKTSPNKVYKFDVSVFHPSNMTTALGVYSFNIGSPDDEYKISYKSHAHSPSGPFVPQPLQPLTEYIVKVVPGCPAYTGEASLLKVTTADACAAPKDITVEGITQTEGTVRWTQQSSVRFRSYKVALYSDNGQLLSTKWISSGTISQTPMELALDGLSPNTGYRVVLSTLCCSNANGSCNSEPLNEGADGWELQTAQIEYSFRTKFEPCATTNITVTLESPTAIKVSWNEPAGTRQQYAVNLIADEGSNAGHIVQTQNILGKGIASNPLSLTFSDLTPNTKYVVQFLPSCCLSPISSAGACVSWASGEPIQQKITTQAETPSACGTTYTIDSGFDNIMLTWQSTNTTPLNPDGRRFIVNTKPKLASVVESPISSPVIDNGTAGVPVRINGLQPNTDYVVEITEAFDRTVDNRHFTQACPLASFDVKTKSKSDLCDVGLTVTPSCATSGSLIFKVENKTGTDKIKLKARYRELSGYFKSKDPNFSATCASSTNVLTSVAVDTTLDWKIVPTWAIDEDNVGSTFIIPKLVACGNYEVIIDQYQVINGIEQICKTHQYPTYLATTDATVSFTDNDKDGIPTDCDADEKIETPSTTVANSLPDTQCGDQGTTPSTSQNLITPVVGQVVNINKIPFEITKINSSANNIISGEGILGLAFANNKLLVNFTNIKINDKFDVVDGTVSGMRTDKTQISTVIKNVNEFNAKQDATFCNKPIEEGFVNGISTTTGTPVDQNGFDANGQYGKIPPYPGYVSGMPFDPDLSPDGKDKNGKVVHACPPGVPYCWVQESPAQTIAGGILYDNVKGNLKAEILKILNSAKDEANKKKGEFEPKCNSLRTGMKTLLSQSLKHEDALVLGPKDAWINQGMSRYFGKVPLPFSINMARNSDQKLFEEKHIELFQYDVELTDAIDKIAVAEELSKEPVLTTLEQGIAFKIKRLGDDASKKMQNPLEFTKWLNGEIELVLKQHLYGKQQQIIKTTAVFDEDASTGLATTTQKKTTVPFSMAADNDNITHNLIQTYQEHPEKALADEEAMLQFEYEQGFTTIGGINRAFILQDIDQRRQIRKALNMEDVAGGTGTGMPISLVKTVSGKEQAVYFDNLTFTTTSAKMDVFVVVSTDRKQIVFQALNIEFNRGGLLSDVSLGLASDVSFPINNIARIILKGDNNTHVKIDCEGFKSLKIKAEIEFCRNYLIPLDPTTLNEMADPAKVKATFETEEIQSFNDIVISDLSITDFALADYKETKFKLSKAVLDFSDTQTPATVKFPEGYFAAHTTSTTTSNNTVTTTPTEQWKGFYISEFKVTLPKKLTSKLVDANQPPVSAQAFNLIIDDGGVSGKIQVNATILPIDKGKLGGWAFSIENFNLGILKNRINEGGFGGKIHVPITKKDAQNFFTYEASILPFNQYQFVLSPLSNIDVSIWKAKATFLNNSKIMIEYKKAKSTDTENQFVATAELYGDLSIGDGSSSFAKMDGVHFEKLTLSNYPKYFKGGKWSMPSVGAKLKGFEIEIDSIKVRNGTTAETEKNIYLDFVIKVLIGGEKKAATTTNPSPTNDDQKFKLAAGGSFTLIGKIEEEDETQNYVFKDIAINKIYINGKIPSATVKGVIEFFPKPGKTPDPKYGEGFFGAVSIDVEGLAGMGAVATFGKMPIGTTNDVYKYFIIDVLADFHEGIPMGAVNLTAAGGGVYWHMKKELQPGTSLPNKLPDSLVPKDISTLSAGSTFTGDTYVPDDSKSIGIRILAGIASAGNKKAFNLNVAFEIAFNTNYGIDRVELRGVAQFMKEPKKTGSTEEEADFSGVLASITMVYDVPNKIFQASLEVKMKLTGGAVEGCYAGYRVGGAEIYLSPKVWFVNIGRTDAQRKEFLSVGIGIPTGSSGVSGGIASGQPCEGKFKFEAYFSIGNSIPPMAPLPDWAQQLAGEGLNGTDQSIRANGRGFAFGARTGFAFDKEFVKERRGKKYGVYAAVNFDLGFDMMLMDYGDMRCGSSNGPKIGIDGWYASGQAYTRLIGAVGVVLRDKRYPILSAGLSLVLQAKGPNPFWMKGNAKVEYSVLGIFKGSKTMKFEAGERCQLVAADPADPDNGDNENAIIAAISPESNTNNVSLRAKPTVQFNLKIGVPIKVVDEDPNDDTKSIEYYLTTNVENKKVTDKKGNEVSGYWRMNDANTMMTFESNKMLPPNEELTISLKAVTYRGYSVEYSEDKTVTFKTEGAMAYIPEDNISSSYPMNGMYNYYSKEINEDKGYIQLIYPQDDLLQQIPEGYYLGARLYSEGKRITQFPCDYYPSSARITYTMPNNSLKKGKVYKMTIGWLPTDCDDEATPIISGGSQSQASLSFEGDGGGCMPSKVAYTMFFRVSNYNTFSEKISSANFSRQLVVGKQYFYNINITNLTEPFDNFEMGTVSGKFPLVVIDDRTLGGTDFWNTVYTNLYSEFPTYVNGFNVDCKSKYGKGSYLVPLDQEKLYIGTALGMNIPFIDVSFYEGKNTTIAAPLQVLSYNKFNVIFDDYSAVQNSLIDQSKNYQAMAEELYEPEIQDYIKKRTTYVNNKNAEKDKYLNKIVSFPNIPTQFKLSFKYKPIISSQPTGNSSVDNAAINAAQSTSIFDKQL